MNERRTGTIAQQPLTSGTGRANSIPSACSTRAPSPVLRSAAATVAWARSRERLLSGNLGGNDDRWCSTPILMRMTLSRWARSWGCGLTSTPLDFA